MKKDEKIKDLFDRYIETRCRNFNDLRPQTIKGYCEVFKHFNTLMPEVVYPYHITLENMELFFNRVKTRRRAVGKGQIKVGVKVSTTRTYWSKLNLFFKWLIEHEYLTKNPLLKIRSPYPQYADSKALNKSQILKIIVAIDLHSKNLLLQKRDKVMLYTFLFCGLRKGELISLRITDIDFVRSIITIRGETSKSNRTRILPLDYKLITFLNDYLAERNKRHYKTESLWVSDGEDKGLSVHGLKHWTKRLNDLSGVKFHLHQFRHTFAYNLSRQNVSDFKIQKSLGHNDIRMTQRYVRSMNTEDLRVDMARLNIDNLA